MTASPLSSTANSLLLHSLSIVGFGLMAGFFWAYSANVNIAMLQMDAATYATVQSAFNRNVRHALFFTFFFGPPAVAALALAAAWQDWRQGWFVTLAVSALLYLLGIIVFTAQVNLPLNAHTESWNPASVPDNWQEIRKRWNSANLWRAWASASCFALATLALARRAISIASARQ